MTLIDAGLWCQIGPGVFADRPALFLDRDGVIVVDTNYLGRVEDLRMIAGSAAAIARCNALGIPVVLVTNQSGIARGYYDWNGFEAVQAAMSEELAVPAVTSTPYWLAPIMVREASLCGWQIIHGESRSPA